MRDRRDSSATEELLQAAPELDEKLRHMQKEGALAVEKVLREGSLATMLQLTADFFRQHPGILVTLLYVQICLVGISYLWSFYMQFGISILEFVRVTDLLLAAFREPVPLGASFIVIIAQGVMIARVIHVLRSRGYLLKDGVAVLDVAVMQPAKGDEDASEHTRLVIEAFEEQKTELEQTIQEMEKSLRRRAMLLAVIVPLFTFVAPCVAGWSDAIDVERGQGQRVVVELKADSVRARSVGSQQQLTWLGATEQFAFFYDQASHHAHAVPWTNIFRIQNSTMGPTERPTSTPTGSQR
jgi:hypothetical protein